MTAGRTAPVPNVLSIAGSDPGGGAGIQADLKTFAALGCHGMAALTALTAQNTVAVTAVFLPPPAFVAQQIRTLFADIAVAAVKIGMLGSAETAEAVADALGDVAARAGGILPIVVDPVLAATAGNAALSREGLAEAIRSRLQPLATLITPNLAEAARLAGCAVPATAAETEAVAHRLRGGRSGAAWLVKGGHGHGTTADDYLLGDEGGRWFSASRIATANTHGTGCTLSAAIAAFLALGRPLPDAVAAAKAFLNDALAGADRLHVGHGPGPVDHFARHRQGRAT